jgi:hypothetical protein
MRSTRLTLLTLSAFLTAGADPGAAAINPGTPWPTTEALRRAPPPPAAVPVPREDRFAGIR